MATAEEVESIFSGKCDLDNVSFALKLGGHAAVVKTVVELDPMVCSDPVSGGGRDREKAQFVYAAETWLKARGVTSYYFNIDAPISGNRDESENVKWANIVEAWGAQRVSPKPQIRYRRYL